MNNITTTRYAFVSRSLRLLLSLAMAAAMPAAFAQGVYKSIGPDGKVIYSDQPPASAGSKVEVIQTPRAPQPAPAAPAASAPPATTVDVSSAGGRHVKKALRKDAPPPEMAPATSAAVDPALEGAVIGVLGIEDIVLQTEEICLKALPSSFKRYAGAADGWRQRNAATVAQARRALGDSYSATSRQNIETGIRLKNQGMLDPVVSAAAASRINWCDRSADSIKNGEMDVYNNPKLTTPLMNARAR